MSLPDALSLLSSDPGVTGIFTDFDGTVSPIVDDPGEARPVADAEADEYFASRPRGSQIGAWASAQSATLENREALVAAALDFERHFEGAPVQRPPNWSGYRVTPDRVEFWYGRPHRLHDRHLYRRRGGKWRHELLSP